LCVNIIKIKKINNINFISAAKTKFGSIALTLPNVFVLPHLGSATTKTRTAMGNLAVSNLEEFFKTGKCVNCVN